MLTSRGILTPQAMRAVSAPLAVKSSAKKIMSGRRVRPLRVPKRSRNAPIAARDTPSSMPAAGTGEIIHLSTDAPVSLKSHLRRDDESTNDTARMLRMRASRQADANEENASATSTQTCPRQRRLRRGAPFMTRYGIFARSIRRSTSILGDKSMANDASRSSAASSSDMSRASLPSDGGGTSTWAHRYPDCIRRRRMPHFSSSR